MASDPAVKLRLTGTFPESRTARLATNPPFPGGNTMPTRLEFVALFIILLRAAPAAKTFVNFNSDPSLPSNMEVLLACNFKPLSIEKTSESSKTVWLLNAFSPAISNDS